MEDDAAANAMLREQGVHALLLRLLLQHPAHESLLTAACGFVSTVCISFNDWECWGGFQTPFPETQRAFLDGGAVAYVLGAMQRGREDKGALIMGFIALSALVWQNADGAAALLGSLDALDRLLVRPDDEPRGWWGKQGLRW